MPNPSLYEVVEEEGGTYAVTWAATGRVVEMDGVPQLGLDLDRADDVASHLEAIDRNAATRTPARLDS